MKIENQVSCLELSQRLKELNVPQESLFCWCGEGDHIKVMLNSLYDAECNPNFKICSAFTVAELGEMLPKYTHSAKGDDKNFKWECCHDCHNNYFSKSGAETEANARAKMLIYLLENGLLKHDNLHPSQ